MAIALSFSRMQDMGCPFKFWSKYIAKTFQEPENDAMRVGSAVHEAIEKYIQHCFKEQRPSDIEWLRDHDFSFPAGISDKAKSLLEDFINMAPAVPNDAKWYAVELKRGFDSRLYPLNGKDGGWMHSDVAFRSIVDYAYAHGDTLYVIDWKTGRGDPDDEQAKIYAHLAYKMAPATAMSGVHKVVVIWGLIAKGKMVRAGEWNVVDTAPLGVPILEAIEKVNSWTDFPAVPCDLCTAYGGCKIPDCPLKEQTETAVVAAIQEPSSSEIAKITLPTEIVWLKDAENAVLFIQFAEDLVGKIKGLLRDWVEKNGPVVAGGKIAELRANTPWKAKNLEQILGVLIKYGIPKDQIFGALSLSESAVEKLLKKNRMVERLPLVLSMGERKDYKPRFGVYNSKDDDEIAV